MFPPNKTGLDTSLSNYFRLIGITLNGTDVPSFQLIIPKEEIPMVFS